MKKPKKVKPYRFKVNITLQASDFKRMLNVMTLYGVSQYGLFMMGVEKLEQYEQLGTAHDKGEI